MPEITLTPEQESAIEMIRRHPISILTGGPGTGKTTTVKAVIDWAESQGVEYALAAPTGKAAKRMNETTDRPSSTIHRLLGVEMGINGDFQFVHGKDNPLEYRFFILDECSMIPQSLFNSFLQAVRPGSKILLVGDERQLPSIGEGAILRDLIASKMIPVTELTVIHRNAGDIVRSCHAIRKGESFAPGEVIDLEAGHNFRHIEIEDPGDIADMVVTLATDRLARRGYDLTWEVQTISPYNSKTVLSCQALNSRIHAVLNPGPGSDSDFKTGSKIINTKNKVLDGEMIVNGDQGEILEIDGAGVITAKFRDPDRTVEIEKRKDRDDLLLSYAITCHRMQGSEAPVIVIPVHSSLAYLVDRPWIYTAISRAQQLCITVGQFAAIETAVQRRATERKTFLVEKLRERMVA
jgi:exodeoxyribonuclease V alpha subunit